MVNNTLKKLSWVLLDNLVLVLVYYLAGHLSMHFLAMPPSNAAAIWPPTGISLAAVLLRGYRVLPAVLIGDLIIAIELFGFNDSFSIVFSLMVGIQAMLTAWMGASLIRHFVGIHNLLIENKSIILFLFLGGPVASLLPSALSISVEYYLQILDINELSTGFITWWQGCSIGVIIFAPLTLILFGSKEHKSRIVSVAIPLIILFVLMVWVFNLSKTREEQRLTHMFKQQANTLYDATVNEIDLLVYEIRELKNYIHATYELDKRKFTEFSRHILTDKPEVLGVAWVPRIAHEGRLAFETTVNPAIAKQAQDRTSAIADKNKDYFSIQFITPFAGSDALTGVDLASNSYWKSVFDKAKRSGDQEIIFPMIINSETKIAKMTVLVAPVFIHEDVNDNGDVSNKHLRGYAILFLPFQYVLNNAVIKAQAQKINLKISEISELGLKKTDVIGQLDANKFSFDMVRQMERFGLTGKFNYFPSADFVDSNRSLLVGWVFLIGLGATGLFGFTLLSVTGQTVLIKRLVEKKTRDLIAERQFLQTVLDSVQEGIVACDEKGELTLFNHAAD
jgi:CHASE1-domain containing sensor protein